MQIKYSQGLCSKCNKVKLIIVKSKKLCLYCNIALKRQAATKRINNRPKKPYVLLEPFYKEFWDQQPEKVCFETGEKLYNYKNWHVHHLIEKAKYPEHALNKDVCVLLTLEQHSLYHSLAPSDLKLKMPNCYKRLMELKQKYNIDQPVVNADFEIYFG